YRGAMNEQCLTLAEAMKESGYATFMTGKWHLGMKYRSQWPLQRGFERFYGTLDGATNFFYPEFPRGITLNNTPVQNHVSTTNRRYYTTDAFTDYAIQFLKKEKNHDDRSFFLYLAYTAPHWPLHAHQEEVLKYIGKYKKGWDQLRQERYQRQKEIGLIQSNWNLSDRSHVEWDSLSEEKKEEMDLRMAYYAAMVDRMDQNIGKLVEALKAMGKYENTLILFLSDNGACQEGGRLGGKANPFNTDEWERSYGINLSYGEVWANASNTPFRKFKHYIHAGGISTPFIAHWPASIKETGGWYRDPAYLIDILPTFLELSEGSYPDVRNGNKLKPITGVSLVPAFQNNPLNRELPLYWEHEDNAAIMKGKWKLVGSNVSIPEGLQSDKWELYDLEKDLTETHDLSGQYPEIVEALSHEWSTWADQVGVYPKPTERKATQ
ncbi:MAG: sulfatase-like hydrolase/transferase, partial [Opitutales bacterium]|nr:sulfatase-like hydrolase/transferase [Opitutales bacterium]